jgi:serine/threonine protein kinase
MSDDPQDSGAEKEPEPQDAEDSFDPEQTEVTSSGSAKVGTTPPGSSDSLDRDVRALFGWAMNAFSIRPDERCGNKYFGYLLTEIRGQGAQGVVYEAWPERPEKAPQKVAIKIATAQPSIERLMREVAFCARLNQVPGVVRVDSFFANNDEVWMVMEWLAGQSLEESIQTRLRKKHSRPFEWREAFAIIARVLTTIEGVHDREIVHLDIKPSNLFLTDNDEVKLLDFGLSEHLNLILGHPEQIFRRGTPHYMAPELIVAPADNGSTPNCKLCDIYSVGATLYRMLTGAFPYPEAVEIPQLLARVHQPPPDPCRLAPDLPKACGKIIQKALALAPEERYASAREFRHALELALEQKSEPSRFTWARAALACTVLLLATGLIALAWNGFVTQPQADGQDVSKVSNTSNARHQGRIDLIVQRRGVDGKLRGVRLNTAGALPLRTEDLFRIEGRIDPPAYLYVLWMDPDHDVTPVYPWDPTKGWGSRPASEVPRQTLRIPEDAGSPWYKVVDAKPGVATVVMIATSQPLGVSDEVVRTWFEGMPNLPIPPAGEQGAIWFDNFIEVHESDRARLFELVESADPFTRWQSQLQKALGDEVEFQTSVSFTRTGQK